MRVRQKEPRATVTSRVFLILAVIVVAGMAIAGMAPGAPVAAQQDGTPDTEGPLIITDAETATDTDTETETEAEAAADSTPTVDGGSLIEDEPAAEQPAVEENLGPAAAITQGLVFVDGTTQVYQVREIELASAADAEPFTAQAGFLLQRTGDTIIRNDLSGKRAKLEPGEAFFTSAGDPYTAYRGGAEATAWSVEMLPQDAVADDAFYESPPIEGLTQGTFDFELIRYALAPGEGADLPPHNGQALMLVTTGSVEFQDEAGGGPLSAGEGSRITGVGTVQNNEASPAVYVVAALGDQVEDEGPAADPALATASAEEPDTEGEATEESTEESTEEDAATDAGDEPAAEPTEEPAAEEQNADEGNAGGSETAATSIAVSAQAPIYVEVVADEETEFAGELDTGETTGQITGTTFRVYTTSGVNSLFTNACGTEFLMGYEEGEATYTLEANEDSCPPD